MPVPAHQVDRARRSQVPNGPISRRQVEHAEPRRSQAQARAQPARPQRRSRQQVDGSPSIFPGPAAARAAPAAAALADEGAQLLSAAMPCLAMPTGLRCFAHRGATATASCRRGAPVESGVGRPAQHAWRRVAYASSPRRFSCRHPTFAYPFRCPTTTIPPRARHISTALATSEPHHWWSYQITPLGLACPPPFLLPPSVPPSVRRCCALAGLPCGPLLALRRPTAPHYVECGCPCLDVAMRDARQGNRLQQ